MGHRAERANGSDRPDHKGLSEKVGGTLELGCNPPRRKTLRNQTEGRRHSRSCGESMSYKGVNPDQKFWPFRLRVCDGLNPQLSKNIMVKVKQSHYRPGQAQRVLRKLRFPDFVTTAQDGGRLSALRTCRLYPQEILLVFISVRG